MMRESGDKLVIRTMTTEDIPQVLTVERACFADAWSEEVFHATLLLPYAHYYVAEILRKDGSRFIIGECGVRDIMGEGEITNVAVLPEHRGFGIGARMLTTLLDESARSGMSAFTLEVRAGNRPAIALYQKLGFRTEGIRTGFYENPVEDALIMWKRELSLP